MEDSGEEAAGVTHLFELERTQEGAEGVDEDYLSVEIQTGDAAGANW